ncbi:hypothetical protein AA0121_g13626 [Alternaria tenuissima]|nr:hypothetical protein AA0121_g13626 [Alternaria tenuissima]
MPDYRPCGKDKALAPWNDEQNKMLDRLIWAPRFEGYTDDDDDYDEFSNAADDGDDYY